MGRPLNKKYFGNKNAAADGTFTAGDAGLGGEVIASVTIGTAGSYTAGAPSVTFSAPTLSGDGAVTATGAAILTAKSATVGTAGTGYVVGDLLTVTSAYGTAIAYVATVTAGAVATVNFTGTGANGGSFVGGITTGSQVTTGGTGTGARITITFGVSGVSITNPGDGYLTAPTVTFSSGSAAGTAVLSTTHDNAILVTAVTVGSTARANSDIVKQTGSHRYRIKNQDGTASCYLVAATPTVAGQASMIATDSAGGTYYVTKLTAHNALLTRNTGTQFDNNTQVRWTLGTPTASVSVKINNG